MQRSISAPAKPAAIPVRAPTGIPPAPPVGGARTFAEMEQLARAHAGLPPVEAVAAAPEAPAQEASTDE